MAQVSMTVSIDSQKQQQIERFCALSGSSREETIDEMINLWERLVYIPWTDFIEKENARRKTMMLLARQRERVANGEIQELTIEEIDNEIAKARSERKENK